MWILLCIVLFIICDVIFVLWLSCKHKINPFNFKKLAEAWKKEFD